MRGQKVLSLIEGLEDKSHEGQKVLSLIEGLEDKSPVGPESFVLNRGP